MKDHIKIFNNHEIGNVINFSKQNSVCVFRISVPVTVYQHLCGRSGRAY